MKLKKLLKKLKRYIDSDNEKLIAKDEALSKVLKKLKRKELKLQKQFDREKNGEERELLEQELKIVHEQRKKGIALLSELRDKEHGKSD